MSGAFFIGEAMTNEELVTLIKANKDTGANMLQLWKQMELFVVAIAKNYKVLAELEDLKQEGYLALYDAVDGYEPQFKNTFSSYAAYHIKRRMRRYIFKCSTMHIPENVQAKLWVYEKTVQRFISEHGREPEENEIMKMLDISKKDFLKLQKVRELSDVGSLDAVAVDGSSIVELLGSSEDISNEIIEAHYLEQLKETLWPIVNGLDEAQANVIKLRYCENLTLEQVGNKLNMDPMKVKCEESKGMRRLQNPGNMAKLRPFLPDQVEAVAFRGSVGSFGRTWTSSTEKAAIKCLEMK